jgi:hypothetical protein
MILELFEIGIAASSAVYLSLWRIRIHRQRTVAWDSLVAQLKPSGLGFELSHESIGDKDLITTPEDRWHRIQDARGFWDMYENAGVMLNMADYAVRNGAAVDQELLAQLRSDATQIRISIFFALSQHALCHATEEARVNIAHVTAIYEDMVSLMSGLVEEREALGQFI